LHTGVGIKEYYLRPRLTQEPAKGGFSSGDAAGN
jgi:hypothetical protein